MKKNGESSRNRRRNAHEVNTEEGLVEELVMERYEGNGGRLWLRMPAEQLHLYEREILQLGCCLFIPAIRLTREGQTAQLHYDLTGLLSLSDRQPDRDAFLALLEELAAKLLLAEDHLLSPRHFQLQPDRIFQDTGSGGIRLIYRGARQPEPDDSVMQQLEKLLSCSWSTSAGEDLRQATEQVRLRIRREAPGLPGILRIVEEIRREWNFIRPV